MNLGMLAPEITSEVAQYLGRLNRFSSYVYWNFK